MNYTIDSLSRIVASCDAMRERVKSLAFRPDGRKVLDLTFGPGITAELVGRTPEALARAEKEGRLPSPKVAGNKRRYYTLEDLSVIRDRLGIKPGKAADEEAVVIAVQNFKGGVGKSTITKHFADYLALRGFKVLVIDCDPQGSTTTMFDIEPGELIEEERTLGDFLSPRSTFDDFSAAIRSTPWPTIDIVPSNLGLQDAEWDLTSTLQNGQDAVRTSLQRLRQGVASVRNDYDVIIMDPPPALGFLGLNVMAAASALLVPVPARQLDYLSTIHFLKTMIETLGALSNIATEVEYSFINIVCSSYAPNKPGEMDMLRMMQATFGSLLLREPILASEEIKNATQAYRSIYESKPSASFTTYQRSRNNLDMVFAEVLDQVRRQWPSQAHGASLGRAAA